MLKPLLDGPMARKTGGLNWGSDGSGGGSRARISARVDVEDEEDVGSDLIALRINHKLLSAVAREDRGAGVDEPLVDGVEVVLARFSDLYHPAI